jgi:membrane-bound lytic murein transglycosylase D
LAGGCGAHNKMNAGEISGPAEGDGDASAYVPGDDGIALSPTELEVLNSTGELDGNLSREAMDEISIQYKYFLHRGRPAFERVLRRAEVYLPHVKQVFAERGMPEELAYLAIVESGYNPAAVSRAGAAGTWQFMPFTGQKYGLAQDWWVDERRDPYKATRAAAEYLAKLYGDFKDWHLAVAAYNAGEGKIGRALEGTGAGDFFELARRNAMLDEKARLKDETRQYVPRFLAVCKLMRHADKLGFVPPDPGAARGVVRLEAAPGTDLTAVARAADMEWAEFSDYNPAFRRHVTPVNRASAIYVPEHAGEKTARHLADAQARAAGGGWKAYTAAKGDTWPRVSAKTGIPVDVLKQANAGKNLRAGIKLRIPGGGPAPSALRAARTLPVPERKKSAPPPATARRARTGSGSSPGGTESVHVVRPGDTLYAVSRLYGTDVESLLRDNGMENARNLKAGQRLRIVGGASPVPAAKDGAKEADAAPPPVAARTMKAENGGKGKNADPVSLADAGTYRVRPGDTLWSIARRLNVPPRSLLRLNNMSVSDTLRPGDVVRVSN